MVRLATLLALCALGAVAWWAWALLTMDLTL